MRSAIFERHHGDHFIMPHASHLPPTADASSHEARLDALADALLADGSAPFTLPTPTTDPLEETRLHATLRARLFGEAHQPLRLGRYRIGRRVGGGGVGYVYEAHDERLDRRIALKVLRPEHVSPDGVAQINLDGEAQALAKLTHPNVVTVYDLGQESGQVYIAMEFVEGPTLRQWLATQRPSEDEIVAIFLQLAQGLAAAHAQGLVHRDFKPDNVLITGGQAKILDFGLAGGPVVRHDDGSIPRLPASTDVAQSTFSDNGQLVGTPAYMAPEQHLGEPVDARADQFAFAVSFYEALVGCRPFAGDDLRTIALAIVGGRWQVRRQGCDLPTRYVALVSQALRVDRNQRFASMNDVAAALRQAALLATSDPPALAAASHDVGPSSLALQSTALTRLENTHGLALPPPTTAFGYIGQCSAGLVLQQPREYLRDEAQRERCVAVIDRTLPQRWRKHLVVAHDEHGILWRSRDAEIRIEPAPQGLTLVGTRLCAKEARRRAMLGTLTGSFAAMFVAITAITTIGQAFGLPDPFHIAFFVLVVMQGGRVGWRRMLALHRKRLEEEQEQMHYLVKRIADMATVR